MANVYIGLGSNLGESQQILKDCLKYIDQCKGLSLRICSSFYISKPLAGLDQPEYVNAVALIETELSPQALLSLLQETEARFGRVREEIRWQPRTLDLDILLYDALILQDSTLTIPHSGMLERDFVLFPLSEIAPELEIPEVGSIRQALENCENRGLVKISD